MLQRLRPLDSLTNVGYVIGISTPEMMRNPEALAMFGPSCFALIQDFVSEASWPLAGDPPNMGSTLFTWGIVFTSVTVLASLRVSARTLRRDNRHSIGANVSEAERRPQAPIRDPWPKDRARDIRVDVESALRGLFRGLSLATGLGTFDENRAARA